MTYQNLSEQEIIQGNHFQWKLVKLLGEGDAGEVYLVESTRDKRQAILKRPHRSTFSADVLRQANQISTEASILKALEGYHLSAGGSFIQIADLVDQSLPGNELSERFYIIIQKARGVDLSLLSKTARYGLDASYDLDNLDPDARLFLQKLSGTGEVPYLVVLRCLRSLFELLEAVHKCHVTWIDSEKYGILWNDVKPDHLFWDPAHASLTVIDWGNGQFLEEDGITKDRLYSPGDDYRQLIEEFGKFLSDNASELYSSLQWPSALSPEESNPEGLKDLYEQINQLLKVETAALAESRQSEAYLVNAEEDGMGPLRALAAIQLDILRHGELPDYAGAARLAEKTAFKLASEGNPDEFAQVCKILVQTPGVDARKWTALGEINDYAKSAEGNDANLFLEAIQSALQEEWPDAHWSLFLAMIADSEPNRYRNLSNVIRAVSQEVNTEIPTPYTALLRLVQMLEDQAAGLVNSPFAEDGRLSSYEAILFELKNEYLRKWTETNPLPPGAGLEYTGLDSLLTRLADLLPHVGILTAPHLDTFQRALLQPKAYIEIILDAWRARGFKTAQHGLRSLLLWDPERRRALNIDRALSEAPGWIDDLRQGPHKGEKLQDFVLRMEFHGRDMRARLATAEWLESALSVLAELRNGARPGDLLTTRPQTEKEFPWLQRFVRKPAPAEARPRSLRRLFSIPHKDKAAQEIVETRFGQGQELFLAESLDSWTPEARGSSARVFLGFLRDPAGMLKQAAVKIMRADKADYALPLFNEETQVLYMLQDISGIAHLMDCGFLQLENEESLPGEEETGNARSLNGKLIRFGIDQTESFINSLTSKVEQGWLPYLAVEKKNEEDCLFNHCDVGHTRGQFLAVESGLQIAIQILDILQIAHSRDIVYRDHKILHYYWNPAHKRTSIIDWNVAKWYPQGLSEAEKQLDLVQFGARGLHHFLTGRPAPGALPAGPTRPQEIESAPHSYNVSWTYDDMERLTPDLRDLLAQVLAGSYDSAGQLREDILIQMARD